MKLVATICIWPEELIFLTRCKEDQILKLIDQNPEHNSNIKDVLLPSIIKTAEKSVEPREENKPSKTKLEHTAANPTISSIVSMASLSQINEHNNIERSRNITKLTKILEVS